MTKKVVRRHLKVLVKNIQQSIYHKALKEEKILYWRRWSSLQKKSEHKTDLVSFNKKLKVKINKWIYLYNIKMIFYF